LLVLNNCKPEFAGGRAEKIRAAVSNDAVETASGPLSVTMSLGLLLSVDWGPRPVEELLQEVDAALYAAKAAGRNCVRRARPERSGETIGVTVRESVQGGR
jgi:GGDEF domain-containing protein